MKRELASALLICGQAYSAHLDLLLGRAEKDCTPEEFANLKQAIGAVMGETYFSIMQPIFREYPDLTPEGLKRDEKS